MNWYNSLFKKVNHFMYCLTYYHVEYFNEE